MALKEDSDGSPTDSRSSTDTWNICLTQQQGICTLLPLSVSSHLKEEGVGVVSQLAQQFGLYPGVDSLLAVLQRWVHLAGRQVQLPAEGDSHHIHVVSAVPEGAGQSDEDWRDTVMIRRFRPLIYSFSSLFFAHYFTQHLLQPESTHFISIILLSSVL